MTDVTRRRFLGNGLAVAESLLVGQYGAYGEQFLAKAPNYTSVATEPLEKKMKGQVLTASDADFEQVASDLWNKYGATKRRPQLIVRVANEQDVVEAVKYARANKLKVTVRGGGHNWCNPSLRNGGMMIDLTNLNQVISIDAKVAQGCGSANYQQSGNSSSAQCSEFVLSQRALPTGQIEWLSPLWRNVMESGCMGNWNRQRRSS